MKKLTIFLLAYLYVHYVIFLPMVMHMHIKLMRSFENWFIGLLGFSPYATSLLCF